MAIKNKMETAINEGLADYILDSIPCMSKRLLGCDLLQRELKMPLSNIQILLLLNKAVLSVGELSRNLGIAKPNVTPLLDTLEQDGLIRRVRDNGDRRVVNVEICDKGRTILEQARDLTARRLEVWEDTLTKAEIKELGTALASLLRITAKLEKVNQ